MLGNVQVAVENTNFRIGNAESSAGNPRVSRGNTKF